jgi:hypothetical protein
MYPYFDVIDDELIEKHVFVIQIDIIDIPLPSWEIFKGRNFELENFQMQTVCIWMQDKHSVLILMKPKVIRPELWYVYLGSCVFKCPLLFRFTLIRFL